MIQKIFNRGIFNNFRISDSLLNEARIQTKSFSSGGKIASQTTVFLSHKHSDLNDLKGLIGWLKQEYNVEVYIDSIDPGMPSKTCGETAERIKNIINLSDRFILLATNDAIESKWCNWELGYGDAKKFDKKIAIFPMNEAFATDSSYKGNEYLEIYPHISYYGDGYYYNSGEKIIPGYYVVVTNNGINTLTPLSTWLRK